MDFGDDPFRRLERNYSSWVLAIQFIGGEYISQKKNKYFKFLAYCLNKREWIVLCVYDEFVDMKWIQYQVFEIDYKELNHNVLEFGASAIPHYRNTTFVLEPRLEDFKSLPLGGKHTLLVKIIDISRAMYHHSLNSEWDSHVLVWMMDVTGNQSTFIVRGTWLVDWLLEDHLYFTTSNYARISIGQYKPSMIQSFTLIMNTPSLIGIHQSH